MAPIDWPKLRKAAKQISQHAYVPYSRYPVGAAALTDNATLLVGCNVENASYGLTLCAECAIISALFTQGGGRLVAITCCNTHGEVIMPCGRCRQLLWEHGGPQLLVDTPQGVWTMERVLPQAFKKHDLDRVADQET